MNTNRKTIRRVGGFTVVETMVALAISLLLLTGVITLFGHSRASYETNDHLARIQENGRFALEMIARDVRSAGYVGCAKRTISKPMRNVLNSSTDVLWNFAVAIEGFDADTGGSSWTPALVTPISTDSPAGGNDVLVVRGPKRDSSAQMLQVSMSTKSDTVGVYSQTGLQPGDIAVVANCDQATAFQITGYTAGSAGSEDTIAHDSPGAYSPGNSAGDLGVTFGADISEVSPVETVVYFVAPSAAGTSNALFRRAGDGTPQEIVEGIDSFQVQYGLDTNGDHLADIYENASGITDWTQVVSVRFALLVRSLDEYGQDRDLSAHSVLDATVAAFNDRRERKVFVTTATLRNRVF